jgi:hypothetical protein
MNAAKRIKRVALYVRVSTDHQTIKNQERELEAVAERHGWSVVTVFKDQGISGAKGRDKRPGLDKPESRAASNTGFDWASCCFACSRVRNCRKRLGLMPAQRE